MTRDICIDRLRKRANHHINENAYYFLINGKWESITWCEYHNNVRLFAKSLLSLGIKANTKVSILGFNRLEWVISAIGAQYVGCVSVGVYTASSKEEVAYVVDHSDSLVLVVENLDRYRKQVQEIRSLLPQVKHIILMSNEICDDPRVLSFNDFLALARNISDSELDIRQEMIEPSWPATMIYTSGTTGNPKSVILSHASIAWTVRTTVQSWHCGALDKAVSYLPLAHVAEQMFTLYAPIDCGMQSYFTPSFEELRSTLKQVEPTVFFGVPRVYEKMHDAIQGRLQEKPLLVRKLIKYFRMIATKYHIAHHEGKKPSLWIKINYDFGRQKIFSRLKEQIGFKKARICVCGAAPIAKDILFFFAGLDIPIYEVYGQSENSGPASFNLIGQAKIGSVGRALPDSEIKISLDKEILLRGPHVFCGYYKDETATNETLKDGWLYTGDVGRIDNDGFLYITDRKKDLLITAGGKNISPQNLEAMLKNLPYVQSAVVIGDRRKYLSALLSPNMEKLKIKAAQLGLPEQEAYLLVHEPTIFQEIDKELENINSRLAPVEQIKRFFLLADEFSIDTGEFTPTMKVKRKFINQKYKHQIDQMYN
jgi:long-chain acyl-CoA synthetase